MKWNKKALYTIFGIAAIGWVSASAIAEDRHEGHHCGHQRFSEEDRAAMMRKRQADLHDKLGLNASQEAAWSTFVSKFTPPSEKDKPNFDEIAKLSTPERLDKMQSLAQSHLSKMQTRNTDIKTFYSVLTPQQQKIFDTEFLPHHGMHHDEGRDDMHPTHGQTELNHTLTHTA